MSGDDENNNPSDPFYALRRAVENLTREVGSMNERLGSIEETLEKRLYDTRPIWEAVLTRMESVEIHLDRVESMALEQRADLRELRRQLKEALPTLK
jgi:hypothetical protein